MFRTYWESGIIEISESVVPPWNGGFAHDLFEFTG